MEKTMLTKEINPDAIRSAMIGALLNIAPHRSAWDRGIIEYGMELVDSLTERIQYERREPENRAQCRAWLLNGATDWTQYSYGGSSLVYDGDIAARLCTPSELRKTRNGERQPNAREYWLDVQARALRQTAVLVLAAWELTKC